MTAADAELVPVGCAVLAAGASRRFGGPKLLVEIEGRSLLARAVAAARASRCARVAVVLGAHADALGREIADAGVERIDNARWNEGVSTSIRAAVAWARRQGLTALLLTAADQPALEAGQLDRLIVASENGRQLAASHYGGLAGIPAIFPCQWFGQLDALSGDTGARELLRAGGRVVRLVPWAAGARDIDRRADVPSLR